MKRVFFVPVAMAACGTIIGTTLCTYPQTSHCDKPVGAKPVIITATSVISNDTGIEFAAAPTTTTIEVPATQLKLTGYPLVIEA